MYWLAELLLYTWVPLVLVLFFVLPPRRAVVVALIGSWLFLPQLYLELNRVPNYSKTTATSYAIIIGALLLDPKSRVLNFRPRWIDLPMGVWMVAPFFASISNGLGPYDGAASVLQVVVRDAMPYLIGRLYFRTPEDAKELAYGFVIGGLLYVPLCLYEVRMSPQLHRMVYGFTPLIDWQMAKRWGGWRPTVFMQHGLAVGLWMATAAGMSFWLWRTRAVRSVFGVPMWAVTAAIAGTVVLCKSTGAIVLLAGVVTAMLAVKYLNLKLLLQAIVFGVPVFLLLRVTQVFDGVTLTTWLAAAVPGLEPRAMSLEFRMVHENAIIGHTAAQQVLGWGGWGRGWNVWVDQYKSFAVPDSRWIHTYGSAGLLGLAALYSIYLLPPMVLLHKLRASEWSSKAVAPVTGLAMVNVVYALDNLFNYMENPVFIVATGGVAGMAVSLTRSPAKAAEAAPAVEPTPAADDETLDREGPLILIDPPLGKGGA